MTNNVPMRNLAEIDRQIRIHSDSPEILQQAMAAAMAAAGGGSLGKRECYRCYLLAKEALAKCQRRVLS